MIKKMALSLVAVLALPCLAAAQDVNKVKAIRALDNTVEIELESSKPFEMRDDITVLRIGKKEFLRSKTPKDGSLNRIVFLLSADEFAQLADGERMAVSYKSHNAAGEVSATGLPRRAGPSWDFGTLDKSSLR
jgi:hypothetical protein